MNGGPLLSMNGCPRGPGTPGRLWILPCLSGAEVLEFRHSFSLELDLGLNPLRQLKTEAPEQGAATKLFGEQFGDA